MEGLLIDAVLRRLAPRLPAERLGWRFVTPHVLVLPLVPTGAVVVDLRPTGPSLRLADTAPPDATGPRTPFGQALVAHAAGTLVEVRQAALDRRCTLRFAPGTGFVPTDEARVEVELTGRNANAVLTDAGGRILAVHREVDATMNRRRQLRPGLAYVPPPPYDKLDPRTADPRVVTTVLRGVALERAHTVVDGVGAVLAAGWAAVAEVDRAEPLEGPTLGRAVAALRALVEDPERVAASVRRDEPDEDRDPERAALLPKARRALERQRRTARRRVDDTEAALAAADDAARLRAEGDLLLAHATRLPRGMAEAMVDDFEGRRVRLELDPRDDAAGNARRRYESARAREARAERALEAGTRARDALERVEATLARLDELPDDELRALVDVEGPRRPKRAPPGLRVQGPHGFEVVIGRSAKENDEVTFRVARSDDLWLHAQGYRGAHVVVRGDGREIPYDTVLFAARLAAGHSEAAQGDNVPVDYTRRRHVWRTKGMPPGAVRFTQQKTVFVTPLRRSDLP